jgi:hypothetical protein
MSSAAVAFFDAEYLIFFFNCSSHSDVREKICCKLNEARSNRSSEPTAADSQPMQRVPGSAAGLSREGG